jgi:hypothetical protein
VLTRSGSGKSSGTIRYTFIGFDDESISLDDAGVARRCASDRRGFAERMAHCEGMRHDRPTGYRHTPSATSTDVATASAGAPFHGRGDRG